MASRALQYILLARQISAPYVPSCWSISIYTKPNRDRKTDEVIADLRQALRVCGDWRVDAFRATVPCRHADGLFCYENVHDKLVGQSPLVARHHHGQISG